MKKNIIKFIFFWTFVLLFSLFLSVIVRSILTLLIIILYPELIPTETEIIKNYYSIKNLFSIQEVLFGAFGGYIFVLASREIAKKFNIISNLFSIGSFLSIKKINYLDNYEKNIRFLVFIVIIYLSIITGSAIAKHEYTGVTTDIFFCLSSYYFAFKKDFIFILGDLIFLYKKIKSTIK